MKAVSPASRGNEDGAYFYRRLIPERCEQRVVDDILLPQTIKHEDQVFSHLWMGRFLGDRTDFSLGANAVYTDYEENRMQKMPFPTGDQRGLKIDRIQGCGDIFVEERAFIHLVNDRLQKWKGSKDPPLTVPDIKSMYLYPLPASLGMQDANRFHVFQFQPDPQTMRITPCDDSKDHYFLRPTAPQSDVYIVPTEWDTVKGLLPFSAPVRYVHTVIQVSAQLLKEWLEDPHLHAATERRERLFSYLSTDKCEVDESAGKVDTKARGGPISEDASAKKEHRVIEREKIIQLVEMLQAISISDCDEDIREEAYRAWTELHFFGCSHWRGQARPRVASMINLLYNFAYQNEWDECGELFFFLLERKSLLMDKIETYIA
mmetsp:Transcript_15681/g.39833  ORF Transcript_15681/g.39833 Transcript_15681/m.39833 type:complete len:375 (+) Transcript_15681:2792-3916(+)